MFRKLGLSIAAGVAVFASLAPIIWSSLDGNTFIASAMGGGLIGCAGYSFGTCTFWLVKQLGHGSLFATVVGLFFRVASAIAAFLLGGLLTFLYIVHIWGPFVYRPGRHFPGDTSILLQSCVGAILTLVLSLLYAFGIVQAWLEMRDRSES